MLLSVLAVLLVAGCGGGGDSPSSSSTTAASGAAPEPGSELAAEGAILASAPEIEPPTGLPPKKLVVKDLKKGTGKEAQKGDRVKIQYYGIDWGIGTEHANSWHYSHIPVFTLGEHRLLRGLNQGIRGMKEGGSREIIIPYTLVYYPGGHHAHLGPLDALVYRVYLVRVLGK